MDVNGIYRCAVAVYFTRIPIGCLVVVFFPTMKRSRGELTLDFHDLVLAVVIGIAALVTPAFLYSYTSPISSLELEHENLETA